MPDWLSNDPAYYLGGSRWDAAARPSVREGEQRKRDVERQVDQLFDRLLRRGRDTHDDEHRHRGALHEAGHGFVLDALGRELSELRVDRDGDGVTRWFDDGPLWTPEDAGVALLAGGAAERLIYPAAGDGCGDDRDKAAAMARLARTSVDRLEERAHQMVTGGAHAVLRLAEVLEARGRVPGAEARAILREHSDAPTDVQPAGYRVRVAGPDGRTETRTARFDEQARLALDLRPGETGPERDRRVAEQFGITTEQVFVERCAARSRVSVGAVREREFTFAQVG